MAAVTSTQDIPAGHYAVVRTPGIMAWVIRRITKSTYNHAFLVIGEGRLIEATPHDVCTAEISEYAGMPMAANVAEPMSPTQCAAAVQAAIRMMGEEYNWPDLAVIGLGDIGLHWKILLRLTGAHKALICSQLVALAGQAAGLDWGCGKESPGLVTPADLARRPGVRQVQA